MSGTYTSLKEFPTRWRWLDAKHTRLQHDEIARLRPYGKPLARELWNRARTFQSKDWSRVLNHARFPSEDMLSVVDTDPRPWLRNRIGVERTPIIVLWQPDLALETDANLFVQYWHTFCHPVADDTTIWPFDESWVIQYLHDDVLYFARSQPIQ